MNIKLVILFRNIINAFNYITNRTMSNTVILQLHLISNSLCPTKNKTPHELILSAGYTTLDGSQTAIKDAPTSPAFASGLNKLYAF